MNLSFKLMFFVSLSLVAGCPSKKKSSSDGASQAGNYQAAPGITRGGSGTGGSFDKDPAGDLFNQGTGSGGGNYTDTPSDLSDVFSKLANNANCIMIQNWLANDLAFDSDSDCVPDHFELYGYHADTTGLKGAARQIPLTEWNDFKKMSIEIQPEMIDTSLEPITPYALAAQVIEKVYLTQLDAKTVQVNFLDAYVAIATAYMLRYGATELPALVGGTDNVPGSVRNIMKYLADKNYPLAPPPAGRAIYYTDPKNSSTDFDIFSDSEEVMGVNNYSDVNEAGANPLITAAPILNVSISKWDVYNVTEVSKTLGIDVQNSKNIQTNTSSSSTASEEIGWSTQAESSSNNSTELSVGSNWNVGFSGTYGGINTGITLSGGFGGDSRGGETRGFSTSLSSTTNSSKSGSKTTSLEYGSGSQTTNGQNFSQSLSYNSSCESKVIYTFDLENVGTMSAHSYAIKFSIEGPMPALSGTIDGTGVYGGDGSKVLFGEKASVHWPVGISEFSGHEIAVCISHNTMMYLENYGQLILHAELLQSMASYSTTVGGLKGTQMQNAIQNISAAERKLAKVNLGIAQEEENGLKKEIKGKFLYAAQEKHPITIQEFINTVAPKCPSNQPQQYCRPVDQNGKTIAGADVAIDNVEDLFFFIQPDFDKAAPPTQKQVMDQLNEYIKKYGNNRLKWPLIQGWTYYIYTGLSNSVMVSSVSVTPDSNGGGVKIAANVMANFGLNSIKLNLGGGYPPLDLILDPSLPGTTYTGFLNWNAPRNGVPYPTDHGFYQNASIDVVYRDPFSATPTKNIAKSFKKFPGFIYLIKPGTYDFKEPCNAADSECLLGCPNGEYANWTIASNPGATGSIEYRCGHPAKSENTSEGWGRGTVCDNSHPTNNRPTQCDIYCREKVTTWNNYKQDDAHFWVFNPTTTFTACGPQPQPARTVDCGSEMLPRTNDFMSSGGTLVLCKPNCPAGIGANGKYWNGDECTPCGAQERSFGGAQTSCTPYCLANNKIVNGRCTPCTGKQLSAGGDVMECYCPKGSEMRGGVCTCKSSIANLPNGAEACVCPSTSDGFTRTLDSFGQCNCDNNATAEGGNCKICPAGMFFNGQQCLSDNRCDSEKRFVGGYKVGLKKTPGTNGFYDDCCYQKGRDGKYVCMNSANAPDSRVGPGKTYGTYCYDDGIAIRNCNCIGDKRRQGRTVNEFYCDFLP